MFIKSIAAFTIQLEAHKQGLGSCWVQIRLRDYNESLSSSEYIKKILCIPERMEVECVIGLGYPNEEKEEHHLSDGLISKIHYEMY